jgi:hypothetical protein
MRKILLALALLAHTASAQQAAKPADVPVKQVVLFSSGVGYFEHNGTVRGTTSTELRFKTGQINDILKSLVLQDEGGGNIGAVTYPSQDPLEKTLHSFSVDISGNPSLDALLNQLRGARVTVVSGGDTYEGTVLGVEEHEESVRGGDEPKIIKTHLLNLVANGMIRAIQLEEASRIQLQDPQLQSELDKALAALAQARDQEKKAVTINFNGEGDRRVRIGYVIETPIWKTSYRLVLLPNEKAKLQGWAIVENQTDTDWNDVALSLVSGRPISFVQDLYQPLYIERPTVKPELYSSLKPQTYEGGTVAEMQNEADEKPAEAKTARAFGTRGKALASRAAPMMASAAGADAMLMAADSHDFARQMDVTASIASVAAAKNLGELFQYSVGNVTLPRQRSAMLPIINDEVGVERLSIFNRSVLATHPLNGARLHNTSGKHLLQGPITVFGEGSYSGDARIEDTPPGQDRLLSYGIDLQMVVNSDKNKEDNAVLSARIVKGALELQRKLTFTQDYVAENKSDKDKTLVIEHPFRANWKLVNTPKPNETTDKLYRFQTTVAAKKSATFTVNEEYVTTESVGILPMDFGQLELYSRTGKIPANVKAALEKAIGMKRAMAETQQQIETRNKQLGDITKEQTRIRENMKTVAQNSDYANRLLKKLNDQESRLETLQKEVEDLQTKLETQRQELESYLGSLNVG